MKWNAYHNRTGAWKRKHYFDLVTRFCNRCGMAEENAEKRGRINDCRGENKIPRVRNTTSGVSETVRVS